MPVSDYGRTKHVDADGQLNSARLLGLGISVAYLAWGVIGAIASVHFPFALPSSASLGGAGVNGLQGLVHAVVGLAGVLSFTRGARGPNAEGWTLAGASALLALLDGVTRGAANVLNLDNRTTVAHLIAMVLALAVVAMTQPIRSEPFASSVRRHS